jgi:hypothetical protein
MIESFLGRVTAIGASHVRLRGFAPRGGFNSMNCVTFVRGEVLPSGEPFAVFAIVERNAAFCDIDNVVDA